jgi:hypothetical protein
MERELINMKIKLDSIAIGILLKFLNRKIEKPWILLIATVLLSFGLLTEIPSWLLDQGANMLSFSKQ